MAPDKAYNFIGVMKPAAMGTVKLAVFNGTCGNNIQLVQVCKIWASRQFLVFCGEYVLTTASPKQNPYYSQNAASGQG